jgi:hypothetical protein
MTPYNLVIETEPPVEVGYGWLFRGANGGSGSLGCDDAEKPRIFKTRQAAKRTLEKTVWAGYADIVLVERYLPTEATANRPTYVVKEYST